MRCEQEARKVQRLQQGTLNSPATVGMPRRYRAASVQPPSRTEKRLRLGRIRIIASNPGLAGRILVKPLLNSDQTTATERIQAERTRDCACII